MYGVQNADKLNDLNDYDRAVILGLLDCQFTKYGAVHGQQAAEEYFDKLAEEAFSSPPDAEIVSIQEQMINDGITCSLNEIIAMQSGTGYGTEE